MRLGFVSLASRSLIGTGTLVSHGGAELQTVLLARELAGRGMPCVLLIEAQRGALPPNDAVLEIRELRQIERGVPLISRYLNWRLILSAVQSLGAEIVVQTAAGAITGRLARASHRVGSKFVYQVASDGDLDGSILSGAREARIFFWGLRNADHVIAQSEWQQRQLLERFGKQSTVIPNAFPIPAEPPHVKKKHILWVASSQRLKQPELFLRLARSLPHERFVMIMPKNDPAVFDEVRVSAESVSNLQFIPGVPFDDIQPFFDAAKVFVNTSTVEGFPNTFIQAAIGATPVVSLNVDPDGVLTTNGFGECAGGSIEALIERTRAIAADAERIDVMGRAGFGYAKDTHDIGAVADRWVKVLESL